MKKFLLPVFALLTIACSTQAQVVFSEDFDGVPGPTAGGVGTYSFPTGWTLVNVDNRTPATNVAYVNQAWTRRDDFNFNNTDSAAFSTSWYTPAGASDDWMITPAIGPLPANTVLSWNAVAYDPAYPDGYEVRIMTTPPVASTGSIGNLVTASTLLTTVAAENSSWTSRTQALSAYTGQTVYIAFRNISNDKFLLLVDDIKLEAALPYDAQLLSLDTVPEYTMIPRSQVYNMPTLATVKNNGSSAITNVGLRLNVFNSAMTQIATQTGSTVANLVPGASTQVSAGAYMLPNTPDTYLFQYIVTHTETESHPVDDTLYNSVMVSDSTFARDNGNMVSQLGIGAGNGGFLGQSFTINTAKDLTSVTYYVTRGYGGTPTACALWNTDATGKPTTLAATTDTILYTDDSARVYTIAISGGAYNLTPGRYVITAIEFDSTLALAQTSGIFRPGTTWVNWPTNPFSTWANNEQFGSSFAKSYLLRLNFGANCANFAVNATLTSPAGCTACSDGTAAATTSNGNAPYVYAWSSGGTAATETNLAVGTYTVIVTDSLGCLQYDSVVVTTNCSMMTISTTSTDASCPACADGIATATVAVPLSGDEMYVWTGPGASGQNTPTATGLMAGTYTVTIIDGGCTATANVTVNTATTTSVKDNPVEANTSIYPNPGKDQFTITIPQEFGNETVVTVMDALGQTLFAKTYNGFGNKEMNLTGLPSGKYLVRFSSTKYVVNKNVTILK